MACNHERLKTIGDRLFCKICGDELPREHLYGVQNAPVNPPVPAKVNKSTSKKRAAKKAK